jgi:hypothetical protein
MVGMGSCNVDYVDGGVFDELVVGAVGFSGAGPGDVFDEGLGAGFGGGGCRGCEDVLDVVNIAGGRVGEEIFGKGLEVLGEL